MSITPPNFFEKSEMPPSFWAAAPKGPMTYAFTHMGDFLLLLLLLLHPPPPGFEAQILAFGLLSHP